MALIESSSSYASRLAREHSERRARLWPAKVMSRPAKAAAKLEPPPPQAPSPKRSNIIDLKLERLVRQVQEMERMLLNGKPLQGIRCREASQPTIQEIIHVVSAFYRVDVICLISARRTARVVWPRQIAMYLAKALTERSLPQIGRRFGGRDHTTVLHAVRKVFGQMQWDDRLRDEIQLLLARIAERES